MEESLVARPNPLSALLWIGVFAFFVGFMGYLAISLGGKTSNSRLAYSPLAAELSPVRLAPPEDPWTFEKAI
ncbi:hypothetical protein [Phenylobacterium sp.]|uniref:hypothetical protein n=1 Tax=Phenylobacterium sp. TaxID=1871053 RepID=UPI0027304967|nr:hypothetical protein [Phenylobacterium sp.]MDP2215460.1 hypothetical protein [Phenylobacterium sp.]